MPAQCRAQTQVARVDVVSANLNTQVKCCAPAPRRWHEIGRARLLAVRWHMSARRHAWLLARQLPQAAAQPCRTRLGTGVGLEGGLCQLAQACPAPSGFGAHVFGARSPPMFLPPPRFGAQAVPPLQSISRATRATWARVAIAPSFAAAGGAELLRTRESPRGWLRTVCGRHQCKNRKHHLRL